MKLGIIILVLIGLCTAFTVRPDYFDVQDTGDARLGTMDVAISIDCDSKDLIIEVLSEETEEPIAGAKTYIFYTDYSYQALPATGTTNDSGITIMGIPGNIRFLTALFVLRVDHPGYMSREIEFAYEKCFGEPPPPPGEEPEEPEEPEIPALKPLAFDITNTCDGTAVTGNVVTVTSNGKAVENIFVDVEDVEPMRKVVSGYTDGKGQFTFAGCDDLYSIRVSAGGYESETGEVELTACNECVEPVVEEPEEPPGIPTENETAADDAPVPERHLLLFHSP